MGDTIKRSKGTVRFIFKESKKNLIKEKNKESLIMLHFQHGLSSRFKFSTGYKCTYNDWDFSKQRIKNKTSILNKDEINAYLSGLESFLSQTYTQLSKKYDPVPNHLLKKKLSDFNQQKLENPSNAFSFNQIIEKYIGEKKGHINIVTERAYRQCHLRLKEFENKSGEPIDIHQIDMAFYYKFIEFLEKKNYSLNTIGKYIKTLKTFLNYAVHEGYTLNIKFKSKDFRSRKEITTEIYLTDREIEQMKDKDLSKYPHLEHARDIFLIGCYTGQRVSDYNYLSKDDIVEKDGIRYFKIKQKKNRKFSRVVLCPITKEMQEIMDERHDGEPPKTMPEPLLNEYLKDLGVELKFNQPVKCEYTKGGKVISEIIPKHDLIKTHTARRSFCTNKYLAGMSVFDIMLFSGHTTEKEFYKYIRIRDEERASHVAKSGFFNI